MVCSLQPEAYNVWDPGIRSTIGAIAAAINCETNGLNSEPCTDFDSHANMPVVGRNSFIISETGKRVDVSPFTPDYKPMVASIVDAAIQYDDPYDGQQYIFVIRNAIHVPSMKNNLIAPFILREAGITVNDVPKIHRDDPTEDDHAIIFKETGFRVPLQLWGIFSYFPTSKPPHQMLSSSPDIYILTPSKWNPHSDAYAYNEESMLDCDGNMKNRQDHENRIVIEDLPESEAMVSCLSVGDSEQKFVDEAFVSDEEEHEESTLYGKLKSQADLSSFKMTIGATHCNNNPYVEIVTDDDDDTNETEEDVSSFDDHDLENAGDEELDNFFASCSGVISNERKVDPKHLAKIWKINHEDAKRTLEVTSHHQVRNDNPTLSKNYGTGDRMLRYRRIHTYFFMDTFFASKKKTRSTRGNTCCQLFVTDKGFVYVVPMRQKSDVPKTLKQSPCNCLRPRWRADVK